MLLALALALVQSAPVHSPRFADAPAARNAGVYHVERGTWTRRASSALLGADVVYDNTCDSGYFSALDGLRYTDDGRLPSSTSPDDAASKPGCAAEYVVDGFEIRYCTDQIDPGVWTVTFHESAMPCTSVSALTPTGMAVLDGLPGGTGIAGVVTCWTVAVDLGADAFVMRGDGDGAYAGTNGQNTFEWTIATSLPAAQAQWTGPRIAGAPSVCSRWDGTRWDPLVDPNEAGTGMGNEDRFRIDTPGGDGSYPDGCHFFGGIVFAGFHLELYADACPATTGVAFCAGDGSGTACPCGNASPVGDDVGCLHSLGLGARLRASGTPSLASDGDGASSLALVCDALPATASCLFFQGTARVGGGGASFGDGLRCAGGAVLRLGTRVGANGNAAYPGTPAEAISVQGAITSPGTRTYQAWYRNAASFCTSASFNLSNGVEVVWLP